MALAKERYATRWRSRTRLMNYLRWIAIVTFFSTVTTTLCTVSAKNSGYSNVLGHTKRLEELNGKAWYAHGGLAICPGSHELFRKSCSSATTVCEVGMGVGLSALLFLTAHNLTTVHEFDIGDSVKSKVSIYLQKYFHDRFIPHWGDFREQIPQSSVKCDVVYVDALHPQDVQYAMKYLGGETALWVYHDGGAGFTKARAYLHATYGDRWIELGNSTTPRLDGGVCDYYLGQLKN